MMHRNAGNGSLLSCFCQVAKPNRADFGSCRVFILNMNTLAELQNLVQDTYNRIWNDWYSTHAGHTQATVTVNTDGTDSGYSHGRNLIIVSIGEGNLEDHDITAEPDLWDEQRWPIWMPNLIHEMLHEYERKVIATPTPAGRALHAAHPHP